MTTDLNTRQFPRALRYGESIPEYLAVFEKFKAWLVKNQVAFTINSARMNDMYLVPQQLDLFPRSGRIMTVLPGQWVLFTQDEGSVLTFAAQPDASDSAYTALEISSIDAMMWSDIGPGGLTVLSTPLSEPAVIIQRISRDNREMTDGEEFFWKMKDLGNSVIPPLPCRDCGLVWDHQKECVSRG